jgi:hypothetical protein
MESEVQLDVLKKLQLVLGAGNLFVYVSKPFRVPVLLAP